MPGNLIGDWTVKAAMAHAPLLRKLSPAGLGSACSVLAFGVGLLVLGCQSGTSKPARTVELAEPTTLCRRVKIVGSSLSPENLLRWDRGASPELEAWCKGVGPAAAYIPPSLSSSSLPSDLAVVSWNVHAGGGDIDALVRDLREGRLDGQPTEFIVLLLQEAFRSGPLVPADPGSEARSPDRIAEGPELRQPRSIDQVARRTGLHLLYVPSMRNGKVGDPAEDRGNAILSSTPLEDWEAVELPLERQRRVAVSARMALGPGGEGPITVRIVNLHFDARSPWRRFYRSFGTWRAEQARAMVRRFADDPVVILGGDLNTWFGGRHERAVQVLEGAFPQSGRQLRMATLSSPWILPDLVLDHLFFRLPEGWSASYRIIEDRYGSDHRPVLARLVMDGQDGGQNSSGTLKPEGRS